jgi:hypothetical protein
MYRETFRPISYIVLFVALNLISFNKLSCGKVEKKKKT